MLIMKKILSVVGITGGTFFLLVAAICVEEWFSDPAYAADMEISGLIMCIVLGIFGVILIVLGIQTHKRKTYCGTIIHDRSFKVKL